MKSVANKKAFIYKLVLPLLMFIQLGCDSSELLDLAFDPPSRKTIDTSIVGVNSFFSDPGFGSIEDQANDIKSNLRLNFVRVLFAWTDGVQASPNSARNYSFYDNILDAIPAGTDVLVILTHTPSWITNSANWDGGDPRQTFVNQWVRPTVNRYKNHPRIIGWEVWNEPDLTVVPSDSALELTNPDNYAAMLTSAFNAIRDIDPAKLVVMASAQSIQQNFPNNLRYNKRLKELGVENVTDIWNVHYYGTSYESVVTDNGVKDFLNSISKPIWITESGEQGPNKQLAYVETAWPFLKEKIPGIERFYYYQYTSTAPIDQSFGLRNTDSSFPVSDLYVYLRDR